MWSIELLHRRRPESNSRRSAARNDSRQTVTQYVGSDGQRPGIRTLAGLHWGISGPVDALVGICKSIWTLYLFTASDFNAVLYPQTLFAVLSMVSGKFTSPSWEAEPQLQFCARLLRVVLWIWLQLLVLDVANQRLPGSIAEDRINKPWRPITSGRISPDGARALLLVSIAVTLGTSVWLGVTYEALVLFMLNWMYNDLGLANDHWLLRNLMNALGITAIGAGATRVACGHDLAILFGSATRWWLMCAGVLLTTIHAQDLYDQEGDAARGRSTAPISLGDGVARWSIGVGVLFWSIAMPTSLGLRVQQDWLGYMGPGLLGIVLTARVLTLRNVAADKRTFKLWVLWTMSLYSLPLAA
ncbi:UbiA prenyltransferase family-domain-containing protein [Xylariaceae sp. FL0594]|nr:UbiA prenyltransferase family-domain-containing protein [Xylariaceae sp. FL0594]